MTEINNYYLKFLYFSPTSNLPVHAQLEFEQKVTYDVMFQSNFKLGSNLVFSVYTDSCGPYFNVTPNLTYYDNLEEFDFDDI